MRNDDPTHKQAHETLAGRALLLLFGIGTLAFLIAIDRADWFAIRPATGTSLALAQASTASDGDAAGVADAHP